HARVATYYEQAATLHNNSWYQSLIYHYAQAGNDAKVLQYKILSLVDYSRCNYELYPILQPQRDSELEAPKQLTKYFDELTSELVRIYNYQPSSLDFNELEARLFLAIGKYYISQGQYKKGMEALTHGLEQTAYLKQHPEIHISYLRQLTFYGIQTWNTDLMRENIQKSMGVASAHQLATEYAIESRLYGLYLSMCGNYEESKNCLHKAVGLFQGTSLEGQSYGLNIAACYNYLGEVERKQLHFEESLDFYDRAIEICTDRKQPTNPTFYSNKSRSLLALGRWTDAAETLDIANDLYGASSILVGRAITKSYLSVINAQQGRFDNAIQLLSEAEKSAKMLSSPMSLGVFSKVKALLLQNFPATFAPVFLEDFETCCTQATAHLAPLPGAYECNDAFAIFGLTGIPTRK
ncbi:MAG: tetratricopeptide repeat protein, partial [Pygmaiobacter sp.]